HHAMRGRLLPHGRHPAVHSAEDDPELTVRSLTGSPVPTGWAPASFFSARIAPPERDSPSRVSHVRVKFSGCSGVSQRPAEGRCDRRSGTGVSLISVLTCTDCTQQTGQVVPFCSACPDHPAQGPLI